MGKLTERLYNGVVKENPTFVQMLGMCPTLAMTTTAINGFGMGVTTMIVLTMSNFMISFLRKGIPDKVRIPAFIVIIASFVTMIRFLLQAYVPTLNESLGTFIPLIVVNCIILGRAESYASKNPVLPSVFDGIGMGLGFTFALTMIGIVREIIGGGTVFGYAFMDKANEFINNNASEKVADFFHHQGLFESVGIIGLAPGAFFVLAFLIAYINHRNIKKAEKLGTTPKLCTLADCANCKNHFCHGASESTEEATKEVVEGKEE